MTITGPNTSAKAFQGKLVTLPNVFLLLSILINSNLHLGWTHVHLKWGQCRNDRYNTSRHPTILLLQQQVSVVNDEAPWGCRRMASAAASRHWWIECSAGTEPDMEGMIRTLLPQLLHLSYSQAIMLSSYTQFLFLIHTLLRFLHPKGTRRKSLLKNNSCPCD